MTEHRLSDFTEEDIRNAKKFVRKYFFMYLERNIDGKIDEAFSLLGERTFHGDDDIHFVFEYIIKGDNLLAAMDIASENEAYLKKVKKRGISRYGSD